MSLRNQLVNTLKPGKSVDAQNAWNLYGDIAWWGVLNGAVTSFLSVFAIRLGGSDTHVGLLAALPALVAIIFSMPGSRMVERETKPLRVLLISGTLNRAGYLAIALIPFFLFFRPADAVVVMVGLLSIPAAISAVAFTTMFAGAVKPEHRAHVVSVRNVWVGITSTAIALVGGKLLDLIVFPVNFQILFALSFAASMVSVYHLSRIRMPAAALVRPPRATGSPRGIRPLFDLVRSNKGFTSFTVVSFVIQWGLFFTSPLNSIYWVRNLNATDGWVGVINTVGSATTILFYPLWGRLTTKYGNRLVMILTTAGLAGYPFFLASAPSVEWAVAVSFWGGVVSSGQALSFFNGLLEVCPSLNRSTYIAVYSAVVGVAAFVSPILSTSLAQVYGIQSILLFGAGLRLFGSLLIWRSDVLATKPNSA